MMGSHSYLDWNATAPLRSEARAAMLAALEMPGNPSSVHGPGRQARGVMDQARACVAALIGVKPAQLVFTSGGTEADVLALTGTGRRAVLLSGIEHDAVRRAAPAGAVTLPVGPDGMLDLDALQAELAKAHEPALVSVMAANNETGVIQPIAEIARIAHAHGALFHCDAVQLAGRLPLDMTGQGIDLLTLSAHKIGGPKGVGALAVREGLGLVPLIPGGGQESRRRGGTENLPGIAGFGAAALAARATMAEEGARITALRDGMETALKSALPGLVIFGEAAPRVPNTSLIGHPGMKAETVVMAMDLAGVAVSAGAACSSGKVERSAVLDAMGVDPALAGSAIRISLGWTTTPEEVERCVTAYCAIARRQGKGQAA